MDHRYRLIAASLVATLALGGHAQAAEFTIFTSGPGSASATGTALLQPFDVDSGSVMELNLSALPQTVDVPAGSTWRLHIDSTEFWARSQVVFVPPEGAHGQIGIWPTGVLTGTVQVPTAEELPEFLTIRFQPSPEQSSTLAEEEDRCRIVARSASEGQFECQIPAATLDIRLKARGFITHYRWSMEIPQGGRVPGGLLRLKRGASVVGWIDSLSPGQLSVSKVHLAPQQAGLPSNDAQRHKQSVLSLQASINDRGFFNFDGVAPGAYQLTVRHPAFAPFKVSPITVLADHEFELNAIQLQPPSRLQVHISPPLDPYHEPWVLTLYKQSAIPGFRDTVHHKAEADDLGSWTVIQLEPTEHSLKIEDSRESTWKTHTIQVEGLDTVVDIDLPFQRVETRVSLDGAPLAAANIWFGGRHGEHSLHRRTNADGAAYFFLPRHDEPWLVEMELRGQQIATTWPAVDVPKTPADGDPWVILPLEVPDTRLDGEVVSEAGAPVPQATVTTHQKGSVPTQLNTQPDGSFVLRGLRPGSWRIEASGPGGTSSAPVDLILHAAIPTAPVQLVLRPSRQLDGQLLSPAGLPIPGALVIAMLDPSIAARIQRTTTDADGLFSLSLPKAAQSARLVILPPGFALSSVPVTLPATLRDETVAPVVVTASELHGTLHLEFTQPTELAVLSLRLLRDGQQLVHGLFLPTWARLQGATPSDHGLTLPGMPPGEYTVCLKLSNAADGDENAASKGVDELCASGYLPPFGDLQLALHTEAPN